MPCPCAGGSSQPFCQPSCTTESSVGVAEQVGLSGCEGEDGEGRVEVDGTGRSLSKVVICVDTATSES